MTKRSTNILTALTLFVLFFSGILHADRGALPLGTGVQLSSPSGTNGRIAFARFSIDAPDVFVIDPANGSMTNLTNDANSDSSPSWSPDGTKIAFAKYVNGVGWNIFLMNSDGSNLSQLSRNNAPSDVRVDNPTWSPDGSQIAFVVSLHGGFSYVYLINVDGTSEKLINSGLDYLRVSWSPDGTRIALFGREVLAAGQFVNCAFVMDADGSGRTCLANNLWPFSGPVWSPDGTKLLYSRVENANDPHNSIANLYVVNAAGGTPTQLTFTRVYDTDPVWSPDGSLIAFDTDRNRIMCLPGAAPCREIYLMNADGTNQRSIAMAPVLGVVSDWQSLTPKQAPPPAAPILQFSFPTYLVQENAPGAAIKVTRLGDLSGNASLDYATSEGTASQRTDYTPIFGMLRFAPGEGEKTIVVPIIDNSLVQGDRTVNLALSNAQGALFGADTSAVLTISDNDTAPPTTNPLDDAQFFVRQHYYDFLGRLPDQAGIAYWTSQITQCGNDQTCIRTKRIDVSNAFFYEAEYQQTGAYVYRLYRTAYGNEQPSPNPDSSNPQEAHKLPSYGAFAPDRAQVVGGPGLGQSQLDFANAFAQRPEFLAKYPASLDGPAFIDAVLATINNDLGVDLTAQKTGLLSLFNSGGRGAVLYRLADDNAQNNPIDNRALIDAEYNRAFVFTQYAGYLRRNSDIAGFIFWLGQVNRFPIRDGNAQHAMVCSFVTSAEYQQRFSSVVTHTNAECPQ